MTKKMTRVEIRQMTKDLMRKVRAMWNDDDRDITDVVDETWESYTSEQKDAIVARLNGLDQMDDEIANQWLIYHTQGAWADVIYRMEELMMESIDMEDEDNE